MKTSYAFLLPLILVLFSCCGKEERCKEEEPLKHTVYYLSDENKSKIPFRQDGLDTLIYVSNLGEEIVLYGENRTSFWENQSVNRNINPDCPFYDYYSYEILNCTFRPKINTTELGFVSVSYWAYDNMRTHKSGFMEVNIPNRLARNNIQISNNELGYSDTITIDNVLYKGKEFVNYDYDRYTYDSSLSVFYNYHYGILRLKIKDGKIWTKKM